MTRLGGNFKRVHILYNLTFNLLYQTKDYSISITHIFMKPNYDKIRKLWQTSKGLIITPHRLHNDRFCHPLCFKENSASYYKRTIVKM